MTVSAAESANQFNSMFGSQHRVSNSDAAMDRILVLNALDAGSRIVPGRKVKIVTY